MHVHNPHYQSSNDAMSDPNVTSLFLTRTEPTTVKANYRLEKSQGTSPVPTVNKLQHHYTWGHWPPLWAAGPLGSGWWDLLFMG